MLDDLVIPALPVRRALEWAKHVRIVLGFAVFGLIACNIALLLGVSAPDVHLLQGLRIGLGFCLATAFSGTLLGFFIACIPLGPLPYLYKLPLASMAGIVIVNGVLAVVQGMPLVAAVVAP